MAISKITLNGVVQIDLTADTVTAQTLLDDYVAHGNDGNTVTGELVMPTARTASDVTVSGATVTIPSGAYASQVQKSVANATYSAVVDNDFTTHSGQRKWVNTGWVAIESGGYIESNEVISVVDTTYNAVPANTTITPTTSAQTIGGANYMMEGAVTVSAMPTGTAGTPTATKGTVSNHAVTVTPSVTNVTGYITGGTKTGTGISVSASELVSGDKSITQNGTNIDVADYSTVTVNVSGGGEDYKKLIQRVSGQNITELPSDITQIGQYAFYQCGQARFTSLPSGVTKIGAYAFQQATMLPLSSLPSGVTTIGQNAFYGCTNLAISSLPSGVTSLGTYTFYKCGITSFTVHSSILSIPNNCFAECPNLQTVTIQGAEDIDSYAFYKCSALSSLTLPSSLKTIGQYAFSSCYALSSLTLLSSVTSIGISAFQYCANLLSISCTGTLTTLGTNAFTGSTNYSMKLTSASFPNASVSSLGTVFGSTTAANACQQLEVVDIGNTRSIAASSFANCYKLQTVILRRSDAICTLSNVSAFLNTPLRGYNSLTGTVYVPNALISTYQTTTGNWKTLYDAGTVSFVKIEGSIYEL